MLLDKLFAMRATSPGRQRQFAFMTPRMSTAGVALSEERAMMYAPVNSAVRCISETVAMLPWRAFEVDGATRQMLAGSRLDLLLHRQPNPEMTAFVFREYLVQCALLWGNGYAEIEFNMMGEIVALWPIHPCRVSVERTPRGVLVYKIGSEDGSPDVFLSARQMFHLKGPTLDGIVGRSMISTARESWGLGIASEQFGAAYFGNGGVPAIVLQETDANTTEMSKEAIANMLESFDRRHGGAAKAGKAAYLEKGFKVEPVGIPHRDAQFIESRKHQVTDVARWFRLPPHKIGDMEHATFSNIEQQAIDFVIDSVQPWTERLEQEADAKLHDDENVITKININGLMRGDSEARGEFYTKLWGIGVYSINDVRRLEDENPVENGDQRFVPLNMIPLDQASEGRQLESPNAAAIRGVMRDTHQRMLKKEMNAITRAAGSDKDLIQWASQFYVKHQIQLEESLLPVAEAVADLWNIKPGSLKAHVHTHCTRYVEHSMTMLAEKVLELEAWEARADKATDSLLVRLAGAKS